MIDKKQFMIANLFAFLFLTGCPNPKWRTDNYYVHYFKILGFSPQSLVVPPPVVTGTQNPSEVNSFFYGLRDFLVKRGYNLVPANEVQEKMEELKWKDSSAAEYLEGANLLATNLKSDCLLFVKLTPMEYGMNGWIKGYTIKLKMHNISKLETKDPLLILKDDYKKVFFTKDEEVFKNLVAGLSFFSLKAEEERAWNIFKIDTYFSEDSGFAEYFPRPGVICKACIGRGKVKCCNCDDYGKNRNGSDCSKCGGAAAITCGSCGGTGASP